MKRFRPIDYDQRPESYWRAPRGLAEMLLNIKGAQRRDMIRDYWKQGRIGELDKALLKPALAKQQRKDLGKIHLAFMGGEYLPPYKCGDVEIARIELASATSDVISIRARPVHQGISYRIVDEYGTRFRVARKTSLKPLTLGELVSLIEDSRQSELGGNLALCFNEMNAQVSCRKEFQHFTRITSDFYPQLQKHFEGVFSRWVEEAR